MAQTTDAVSFRNCKIEMSTNGSTWTNISGFANSISVEGGERNIGEFFTFDGDTPILTAGKRGAFDLTAKVVYTEGASDPYEVFRAAYEAATDFYLRWSPKGGTSGQFMFTTGKGIITTPAYPGGEASSPDAIAFEFKIKVLTITKSVVA